MDTLIIYKKGFTGYNEEKVNSLVETRICFTRRRSMVRVHLSPPCFGVLNHFGFKASVKQQP